MDRVDYQSLVIQDLVNLRKADELDISPWYQRRAVWNPQQRAFLVNTLLENKPIPAIYVRHSLDFESQKSVREIVDGQQRVRSILGYYDGEFTARHPDHGKRVAFEHLSKADKERFLLTAIPVAFLLGATDSDVVEIFGRINSVSKSLNAQEKRNAQFGGEFKQFCLREAASRLEFWRSYGIFSANDISRMTEVQFYSDVVLNMLKGLSDYSARALDRIYAEFDTEFPKAEKVASDMDRIFDAVAALDPESIKETIFKRQPLFFSLLIILHQTKRRIAKAKLENALYEIDALFNDESITSKELEEFRSACRSSTQRIRQRQARHDFLKAHVL